MKRRTAVTATSVWTIPNAISAVRIVLIGVFLVLLIREQDGWAITALVVAGVSDFLDGFLARRWNQSTNLGRILDPAADRLLILAVVIGFAVRGIIPWWLLGLIVVRDVIVGLALLVAKRHRLSSPQVTFVGKAATLALYFMLPLAYLAHERWDAVHAVAIVGTTLATAVYWFAGAGYVRDVITRVRDNSSAEDKREVRT